MICCQTIRQTKSDSRPLDYCMMQWYAKNDKWSLFYNWNLIIHKWIMHPPDPLKALSYILPRTMEVYQQGWQQARESTASSPSGIHFGHYIVGTFNSEILLVNAKLADIPLQTGFSLAHWRKGLNVMLEKVSGNVNMEKLHIILLFEADFNYNNKWLGRVIMFNAESTGMMANEQYGSCKHKFAIVQCLNKTFFCDLVWFRWQPAALCSNDVKSCYDCIVLLVAALCMCHLGANKKSVFSMISTLQQMDHHIWTTYGDSAKSGNWKKWGSLITGMGQGNGAGPQIRAAVSSPLLELMKEDVFLLCLLVHFLSPLGCWWVLCLWMTQIYV